MSAAPLVLRASSSHLYPGARLRLADADAVMRRAETGADVLLLFADGAEAAAHLTRGQDGDLTLQVTAYTTARGTFISARAWRITAMEPGRDGQELRLGGRLPTPRQVSRSVPHPSA